MPNSMFISFGLTTDLEVFWLFGSFITRDKETIPNPQTKTNTQPLWATVDENQERVRSSAGRPSRSKFIPPESASYHDDKKFLLAF